MAATTVSHQTLTSAATTTAATTTQDQPKESNQELGRPRRTNGEGLATSSDQPSRRSKPGAPPSGEIPAYSGPELVQRGLDYQARRF